MIHVFVPRAVPFRILYKTILRSKDGDCTAQKDQLSFIKKKVFLAAETTGRAVVGGAALFGVGALCYYGLGLSNEMGAIDRAMVWPQVVRDRVRSTYSYFAGSLAVTAVSAYVISQSRAVFTLMRASPWLVSNWLQLRCFDE